MNKDNGHKLNCECPQCPPGEVPTVEPDEGPTLAEQVEAWELSHWFKPPTDVEDQILTDEEFAEKYGGKK